MTYDNEPTFRLLKPNGREPTDEFSEFNKGLTEPLTTCAQVALTTAEAASDFFRGLYPLPMAMTELGEGYRKLPWFDAYNPKQDAWYQPISSTQAEIEKFAEHLRDCESMRGGAYCYSVQDPTPQWTLQCLAVEVMMAVDRELRSIKAGDLAGALRWQGLAFENLMECQGQAHVVLGPRANEIWTSAVDYVPSYVRARRPERVRKALPDHLAAPAQ